MSAENTGAAKVVSMLQEVKKEKEVGQWVELDGDTDAIVLDTTAEFCKQVGENEKKGEWLCME